jgi:phytoene dehydrogenase-like protein
MVLVPTGHLLADGQAAEDLEAAVERSRTAVEEHLARFLGRPLGPLRKFERVYTPRTWQTRYHLERGSAFGLSHTFTQVGYLRPANRHLRYRNLYFVGASTHPGTGLPIVLLSARLTAQRIVEEWAAWFAARRHPVLTTSTAG